MRFLPYFSLATLLLGGCAGGDLLVQRQGSMEGRLNQMMQAQSSMTTQLAEMSLQLKELKEQAGRSAAAEKSAAAEIASLQERVGLLSRRLERIGAETPPAAARIELVNSEPGGGSSEEQVQAAYMRAFGLFSANSYDAAATAFAEFIASHPESEHAANARYWLAECHFAAGRYREAIDAYAQVMQSPPSAGRSADAMLKTGLAWYGLKEEEKGGAMLRALVDKYPASEAATAARAELGRR